MFSLIALYFAHRRLAGDAVTAVSADVRALTAANEREMQPVLPLAA